jgi:hypothetical protein
MQLTNRGRLLSLALAASFVAGSLSALDIDKLPPHNWAVAKSRPGVRTTMTDATPPRAFIGLTPCRIVDTRGNGALIMGGAFTTNQIRNWTLVNKCGLPAGADAVSVNLTVTGTGAHPFGFVTIWPKDAPQPTASNINWSAAGQTIANAVIMPLGTFGAVSVISGNAGTDMVLDINGYFSSMPGTPANYFELHNNSGVSTLNLTNASTTCSGDCGIYMAVESGTAVAGHSTTAGDGVYGTSTDASGAGVHGFLNANVSNSAAVFGEHTGATGATIGVSGTTTSGSPNAAGVRGLDGTGLPRYPPATAFISSGVRGESRTDAGVLGLSEFSAVIGTLFDSAGVSTASGFIGTTFGTAADATTGPWGVFSQGNLGATGAKHFVEPHPTDATKTITYSSLEGREVGTYFRGTARVVNHRAVISVPEDFRTVTDEEGLTVQLTAVGAAATMYVESQDLNSIVINSSKDIPVHYLVQGVRRAFRDFQPVNTGFEFMPASPDAKMPASLTEEARRRLVSNGTYNADGTVNMGTAEKAGFAKIWSDREAQARARASKPAEKPVQ